MYRDNRLTARAETIRRKQIRTIKYDTAPLSPAQAVGRGRRGVAR